MRQSYETYSAEQFLDDPSFIEWIKYRNAVQESFWNDFMNSDPSNLMELQKAVRQLELLLSAERIAVPEGEEERIWARIDQSIAVTPEVPLPVIGGNRKWWWVAAAVVLLLAGALYIFSGKEEQPLADKKLPSKDGKPIYTAPTLTLADGSVIVLDSGNAGNIAQQGNAKLVQLNGSLSYQQQGTTNEILYNTISTPKGGMYQLVLSDGSKVWLNAMSSLRYPVSFGAGERRVEVNGEAYFEISKDAARPFIVQKNDLSIAVLGTGFNVNTYDDEEQPKITLAEGSVKVEKLKQSVILEPGQQVIVFRDSFQRVNQVNLQQVVAWKHDRFSFYNIDTKAMMRELSRWYDIEVIYQGTPPDVRFSGEISRSVTLTQLLDAFSSIMHIERKGNTLTVLPEWRPAQPDPEKR